MIITGFMMENERAIKILDSEINAWYDTGGKTPPLDFVVEDISYIHNTSSRDYREVHVEGYFPFNEDLKLIVTADGEWDCKETKEKREKRIGGVKDYNTFRSYRLSATIQTDEGVYVEALEKLEFPWEQQFEDRKLTIDGDRSYYGMFTQIRLLGLVEAVQGFVDAGLDKELEKTQKELESKIEELGLREYPVKYQARYKIAFNSQDSGYDAVPVSKAQYTDSDTGVGFEIEYYPASESDTKRKTTFWVTIPENVPKWVKNLFSEKLHITNIDGEDIADFIDFEERVYSGDINFSVTEDEKFRYFSWDEKTFLDYFVGWKRALHLLKHGKPERLESEVFGSDR